MDTHLFLQFVSHAVQVVEPTPQNLLHKPGRVCYVVNRCFRGEQQAQCMALDLFVPESVDNVDAHKFKCTGGHYYRMLLHVDPKQSVLEWTDPLKVSGDLTIDRSDTTQTIVVREVLTTTSATTSGASSAKVPISFSFTLPPSTSGTSASSIPSTRTLSAIVYRAVTLPRSTTTATATTTPKLYSIPVTLPGVTTSTTIPTLSGTATTGSLYSFTGTGTGPLIAGTTSSTVPTGTVSYATAVHSLFAPTSAAVGTGCNSPFRSTVQAITKLVLVKVAAVNISTTFDDFIGSARKDDAKLASLYYAIIHDFDDNLADYPEDIKSISTKIYPLIDTNVGSFLWQMVRSFEEEGLVFDKNLFFDLADDDPAKGWADVEKDQEATYVAYNDVTANPPYDVLKTPLALFAMAAILGHMDNDPTKYLPAIVAKYVKSLKHIVLQILLAHCIALAPVASGSTAPAVQDNLTDIKALALEAARVFQHLFSNILTKTVSDDDTVVLTEADCYAFDKTLMKLMDTYEKTRWNGTNANLNYVKIPAAPVDFNTRPRILYNCFVEQRTTNSPVHSFLEFWKELRKCKNILSDPALDTSLTNNFSLQSLKPCIASSSATLPINVAYFLQTNAKDVFGGLRYSHEELESQIPEYYKTSRAILQKISLNKTMIDIQKTHTQNTILTYWLWLYFIRNMQLRELNDDYLLYGICSSLYTSANQNIMLLTYYELYTYKISHLICSHKVKDNELLNLYRNLLTGMQKHINNSYIRALDVNALEKKESKVNEMLDTSKNHQGTSQKINLSSSSDWLDKYKKCFNHLMVSISSTAFWKVMNINILMNTPDYVIPDYLFFRLAVTVYAECYKTKKWIDDKLTLFSEFQIDDFMELVYDIIEKEYSKTFEYKKNIPLILILTLFNLKHTDAHNSYSTEFLGEMHFYDKVHSQITIEDLKKSLLSTRKQYTLVRICNILMAFNRDHTHDYPHSQMPLEEQMTKRAVHAYHQAIIDIVSQNPSYLPEIQKLSKVADNNLIITNGILSRKVAAILN